MKPGWNRKGPTVHVESTRDRINLRASKIHLQLEIPSLAKGIVDFLQPFGNLYHGHLLPDVFDQHYQLLRAELFHTLQDCVSMPQDHDWVKLKTADFDTFHRLKTAAFWLDMMRTSQNNAWRWPAVAKVSAGRMDFVNGRSRLLASGMTKREPANHLEFLIWVPKTCSIDHVLQTPRLLAGDQDLHAVLGLQYDDQEYDQPQECHMGIEWNNGQIVLAFFNNAFDADFTERSQQIWYDHVAWRQRYGARPELKIFTNWPDRIRDSARLWQWQVIGSSQAFMDNLLPGKPGSIHWAMHNHVHGHCEHDHVLWITTEQTVDVSDLVCWMDLKHTTFVDSQFGFALYRRDALYNNMTVDITA